MKKPQKIFNNTGIWVLIGQFLHKNCPRKAGVCGFHKYVFPGTGYFCGESLNRSVLKENQPIKADFKTLLFQIITNVNYLAWPDPELLSYLTKLILFAADRKKAWNCPDTRKCERKKILDSAEHDHQIL